MNLKQINLFREMVRYFELAQGKNINDVSLSKSRYAKDTLDTLENRIPTERELELQSNIIDYEYYIKKHEHSFDICNLQDVDPCNDLNCIENHRHNIEVAEKELHEIAVKKVRFYNE